MSKQLRVKAEGSQPNLSDLIEKLASFYIVVKTSKFIDHPEDSGCHIYLTLLEERYQ